MTIATFEFFGISIKLYEVEENRNMINRSVYSLSIEGNGTKIISLGDDLADALERYEDEVYKAIHG